jgi:hypothetical protein
MEEDTHAAASRADTRFAKALFDKDAFHEGNASVVSKRAWLGSYAVEHEVDRRTARTRSIPPFFLL